MDDASRLVDGAYARGSERRPGRTGSRGFVRRVSAGRHLPADGEPGRRRAGRLEMPPIAIISRARRFIHGRAPYAHLRAASLARGAASAWGTPPTGACAGRRRRRIGFHRRTRRGAHGQGASQRVQGRSRAEERAPRSGEALPRRGKRLLRRRTSCTRGGSATLAVDSAVPAGGSAAPDAEPLHRVREALAPSRKVPRRRGTRCAPGGAASSSKGADSPLDARLRRWKERPPRSDEAPRARRSGLGARKRCVPAGNTLSTRVFPAIPT